jgi:hypothetical protein
MVWHSGTFVEAAGRYSIVPALLLFSVAAVMVDRHSRRRDGEARPAWLAWGLAGLAVLIVAFSFRVAEPAARGVPPWDSALDEGAAVCAENGGTEAIVSTSPPGWGLNVPCPTIEEFTGSKQ